jgi:hypothetical protein
MKRVGPEKPPVDIFIFRCNDLLRSYRAGEWSLLWRVQTSEPARASVTYRATVERGLECRRRKAEEH